MPKFPAAREVEAKRAFLDALAARGTVTHACETAKISRAAAYKWREQDEDFARAWDEKIEESVERLEASAYERAMKGDTVLTIFLLKGARPHKYRDNAKVEVVHGGAGVERALAGMSNEQLLALFRGAAEAAEVLVQESEDKQTAE